MNKLLDNKEYSNILEYIKKGKLDLSLSNLDYSSKAYVISNLNIDINKSSCVICSNKNSAKKLINDLKFFTDLDVLYYPAREIKYYTLSAESKEIENERMNCISSILNEGNNIIVTTIDAVLQNVMPIDSYQFSSLSFDLNSEINMDDVILSLTRLGYERCSSVDGKGQFAVRGGIIDIYGLDDDNPYRIELFGNEVDSIREFDSISQRSIKNVENISFSCVKEFDFSKDKIDSVINRLTSDIENKEFSNELKENILRDISLLEINEYDDVIDKYFKLFIDDNVTFLDYLKDYVIYFDNPSKCLDRSENIVYENSESIKILAEKNHIYIPYVNTISNFDDLEFKLKNNINIYLEDITKFDSERENISFNIKNTEFFSNKIELLINDINKRKDNVILLIFPNISRANTIKNYLKDNNIFVKDVDNLKEIKNKGIYITVGNISSGFDFNNFTVITESISINKINKKKSKKESNISSFEDLKIGDYIVHEVHGIGIYKGIEKIESLKSVSDYIKIEYREGSNIYIPMSSLDSISKYIVDDGAHPKINKLGTTEWAKTRSKAKKHIEEIAKDLVMLYAKRDKAIGYAFSKDTSFQKEFEDEVPFELTEDQKVSIEKIKEEMELPKPMDMLLCGDVGYGKTEVAIRAAFKAVVDNKQVAYLVPTTVLCLQQFNTFKARMDKFGIKVEMLSRFRSKKEQTKIIEGLKYGTIDIVVGTHRMISEDVKFKDLGLLIIDEEHRFGVSHKEKIKKLKSNIDVISMTATPIPRTLHMSMIGIRSMATLMTPPLERLPIHTYVLEYDKDAIKEAISKELDRDGQVFYVYNRVEDIQEIAFKVKELVKGARVEFAHGQMTPNQIENIMLKFINKEIDVLVCTTILESGIDIPNANTIIIEDANRFGLASLYQIRGRVGRSNRLSYAYITYKKNKLLNEVAEKRLKAIKDFTEFGSGFKIAMRDLQLRGAGNLLGKAQHGHMVAIGYELYVEMLKKAILKEKNEELDIEELSEVKIDLPVSAYIPKSYIDNDIQKVTMYHKLSECNNSDEIIEIVDEFLDRFGDIPKSLDNLIKIVEIRNMCRILNITKVNIIDKYLCFHSENFKQKLKYYINNKDILMFTQSNLKDLINKVKE